MITKNFRLNALANQYAAALYNHITATNGGEWFTVDAAGTTVHVEIIGGIKGVRQLVDAGFLQAANEDGKGWERVAIYALSKCVNGTQLTADGLELWQSMVRDMGDVAASHMGGNHA
ncbi:TPA: hypothetical protein N5O22_002815 [Enterobacter hormaechei subsp. xiangfangensis]|nr:hypothetical protein [Enterobacter hormaechei subsp. xiangfangensis]